MVPKNDKLTEDKRTFLETMRTGLEGTEVFLTVSGNISFGARNRRICGHFRINLIACL